MKDFFKTKSNLRHFMTLPRGKRPVQIITYVRKTFVEQYLLPKIIMLSLNNYMIVELLNKYLDLRYLKFTESAIRKIFEKYLLQC